MENRLPLPIIRISPTWQICREDLIETIRPGQAASFEIDLDSYQIRCQAQYAIGRSLSKSWQAKRAEIIPSPPLTRNIAIDSGNRPGTAQARLAFGKMLNSKQILSEDGHLKGFPVCAKQSNRVSPLGLVMKPFRVNNAHTVYFPEQESAVKRYARRLGYRSLSRNCAEGLAAAHEKRAAPVKQIAARFFCK